ncbi:hypothetical protein ACWV27_23975 [Massilia varians]
MNQTTSPLHRSDPPPFPPYKLYEASQYASYRPVAAITLTGPRILDLIEVPTASPIIAAPTKSPTIRVGSVTKKAERERQARAHEIHGWLDNLHLRYENYIVKNSGKSGTVWPRNASTSTAHAVTVKAAEPATKKARGAPKKVAPNRLKPYLKHFMFPREALERLPMFDDIVTGAVKDSGGNTRPLSKTMMVSLLQGLDEIAAGPIQDDTGLSLRHSQRIAMCLRIIERASFKVAQKHWYIPNETDWADFD